MGKWPWGYILEFCQLQLESARENKEINPLNMNEM